MHVCRKLRIYVLPTRRVTWDQKICCHMGSMRCVLSHGMSRKICVFTWDQWDVCCHMGWVVRCVSSHGINEIFVVTWDQSWDVCCHMGSVRCVSSHGISREICVFTWDQSDMWSVNSVSSHGIRGEMCLVTRVFVTCAHKSVSCVLLPARSRTTRQYNVCC